MGLPWACHGSDIGLPWVSNGNPWIFHFFMFQVHGPSPMGLAWVFDGISMNYSAAMGLPRDSRGCPAGFVVTVETCTGPYDAWEEFGRN